MKVGKSMSFPMDLQAILPPLERNEHILADAQSSVERPIDQLKYSLFWFIKATQFDEIAINHLTSGNIEQAKAIWSKSINATSLQNLLACAIIENNYNDIAIYADKLFQEYSPELSANISDTLRITPAEMIELFVDALSADGQMDVAKLARVSGTSVQWQQILGKGLVKPIISNINNAIAEAKKVKGARQNYDAGVKLMNNTQGDLQLLKGWLGTSNMEYQMIADKLAQSILQCGINYFNDSDDDDAPEKAMKLQNYALSIAVGQLAKERCQENVNILKKIGPEYKVQKEMGRIADGLKRFNLISKRKNGTDTFASLRSPYKLEDINKFIEDCKPDLQAIKVKLSASNELYVKISSTIASAAINALVDVINKAQQSASIGLSSGGFTIVNGLTCMRRIGSLDMSPECRNYYQTNYSTLNQIYNRVCPPVDNSSGGCYIATMVYGDYDHPKVIVLRHFRDEFLDRRNWGKKFIKFYYKHSPGWVEKLKSHKLINKGIQKILDSFIFIWKKISHYE